MRRSAIKARQAYEAAVVGLGAEARRRLDAGQAVEEIAKQLVAERNRLKLDFRENDPPAAVRLMERRNRAKYGHPLGPDAEWLFDKYGSWEAVIDAACRHADLRRAGNGPK